MILYIRFENWVLEARKPLESFRKEDGQRKKSSEESSYLLIWLQQTLSQLRRPSSNSSTSSYIWEYEIFTMTHTKVKVCKMVFAAILGISYTLIDYAQKRIKQGVSTETLTAKAYNDKDPITLEDALQEFQINCDEEYRRHMDLFVRVEKIPRSNEALVCVAFLCEFFKLCGDHEVCTIDFLRIIFIFRA